MQVILQEEQRDMPLIKVQQLLKNKQQRAVHRQTHRDEKYELEAET